MQEGLRDAHTLPLKGVVLCSTSLTQDARSLLSDLSSSMGAIHRLDLTTDVTHLIVGHVDTPKYKHVAKERSDIYVLRPEWIQAIRNAWTSGDDFDVQALNEEYRLPTFYRIQICVTGFDDLEQRQDMIAKIHDQEGHYNGDLTRAVTHLIAKRPEGPKYDRAKQWGLKIVSLKWFEESMVRGMALEEALYDPLRPVQMQGQGAFVREVREETSLGKRRREDAADASKEGAGKRKLRRTMSAKLNNHSQSMWAGMNAMDEGKSLKPENEWLEPRQVADGISPGCTENVESRDITPTVSGDELSRPVSRAEALLPAQKRGLFSNCLFLVIGHPEKRATRVAEILQNEGGQIAHFPKDLHSAVESTSHSNTVLIVPSEWTASSAEPLPDLPAEAWLVTEWWIQRCIVSKSFIDPEGDVYSRPRLNLADDCFKGMIICTSGMGNDAKHVSEIAKYAGARYEQDLKPNCTVLIIRSPDANREKIAYAMKHNVPVISEDWLKSSLTRGEKMPITPYQMPASKANIAKRNTENPRTSVPVQRKDESLAQRLSVTRKKSVTPSLKLAKTRPIEPPRAGSVLNIEAPVKAPTAMPFMEEDYSPVDEPPPLYTVEAQTDGPHSQVLQDLAPQVVNSPEKRSQDRSVQSAGLRGSPEEPIDETILLHTDSSRAQTKQAIDTTIPDENHCPASSKDNALHSENSATADGPIGAKNSRLTESIKSLLDRRKEIAIPEKVPEMKRRKERKLGRALSNMSNPSAPVPLIHSRSMEIADSTASTTPLDLSVPIPSQQLGYETADAKEHRARMTKRMGTNFSDGGPGVRVESIGVVKDIDADTSGTGVGTRVRGRHRNAKG